METVEERPGLAATLRALNAALGRPASLWVKESSARNLRHRDFLAPRAALGAAYAGGQGQHVPGPCCHRQAEPGGPAAAPCGMALQQHTRP